MSLRQWPFRRPVLSMRAYVKSVHVFVRFVQLLRGSVHQTLSILRQSIRDLGRCAPSSFKPLLMLLPLHHFVDLLLFVKAAILFLLVTYEHIRFYLLLDADVGCLVAHGRRRFEDMEDISNGRHVAPSRDVNIECFMHRIDTEATECFLKRGVTNLKVISGFAISLLDNVHARKDCGEFILRIHRIANRILPPVERLAGFVLQ